MKKKQKANNARVFALAIAALFIVSWLSIAVFGFLYIGTKVKYEAAKEAYILLEQQLNKKSRAAASGFTGQREDEAMNFVQWQFVLRDQVEEAKANLSERIAKVKNIAKNKGLLNLLYYNLGLNYTLAVDYAKAISAFEEALKFDSSDSASAYNLGLLYSVYQKDANKAVKYYRKYLKLSPSAAKAEEVRQRITLLSKR